MIKQLFLVAIFATLAFALDGDTFTINCAPLSIQRSDPIVNPGTAGGHVHAIIGGNAFSRKMGPMDARNIATATTCNKGTDHSNYWVPQLYHQRADGKFEMVHYSGSAVYYQKRACDYNPTAKTCDKAFVPLAPPDGFRMLAGDPARRIPPANNADFPNTAIAFMCIDGSSGETHGFPPSKCRQFRSEVYFPSCWDGINIDPPDHKSHVAYPAIGNYNGGICPQTHPKAIFSIFYEFYFETGNYTDINKFVLAQGDPTGFGYHGDFVMGWTNRTALQNAHRDCINSADCPTLQNQPANPQTLIFPAIFEEDIGLAGNPIASLPGNNPVTWPEKSLSIPSLRTHRITHH